MTNTKDNKKLQNEILIMSLYFFFYFGAVGFIQPFISLQFHKIELTGLQIGMITTISSLLVLITAASLGAYYDTNRNKRVTFQVIILLGAFFLSIIGWVKSFIPVLVLYSVYRICGASNIPTAENLTFNISLANKEKKRSSFGYMRQFGSLSFAFTAMAGGWIIEKIGIQTNFILYFIFMLLVAGFIAFLPSAAFENKDEESIHTEKSSLRTVFKLIVVNKYLWLMIGALSISNPLNCGVRQFEPIFMSQLGLSEGIIGLAATLSAFTEIPFMLWADNLLKRVGITRLLIAVIIIDLLRRFLVYAFPIGWIIFVMNVATSISFSLRLVIVVTLINKHVPRQYATTTLSFITMTLYGIVGMISSLLSGIIFDVFSGRELYLFSGLGCLLSLGMVLLARISEKEFIEADN